MNRSKLIESLFYFIESGDKDLEIVLGSLEKEYGGYRPKAVAQVTLCFFKDSNAPGHVAVMKEGSSYIVNFLGDGNREFPEKLGTWANKIKSEFKKKYTSKITSSPQDGWVMLSLKRLSEKQIAGNFIVFKSKLDKEFKVKVGGVSYYAYSGLSGMGR